MWCLIVLIPDLCTLSYYGTLYAEYDCVISCAYSLQGSYKQDCENFKDFSMTSKRLSYCFQGLKTYKKNTDLHAKILLRKC